MLELKKLTHDLFAVLSKRQIVERHLESMVLSLKANGTMNVYDKIKDIRVKYGASLDINFNIFRNRVLIMVKSPLQDC